MSGSGQGPATDANLDLVVSFTTLGARGASIQATEGAGARVILVRG